MQTTQKVNYKELCGRYITLVNNRLDEVISEVEPDSLKIPFKYLIDNGGKRFRPILTMLGAGAVGGNPVDVVDLGVSLEILHNFTLVHDDIMDGSPLRRGKPTVHRKWDLPTGILVGDVMIGWACKMMPKGSNHPNSATMQDTFQKAIVEVCIGQAYDMDYNKKHDVSIDDYIMMISKKTSFLLTASITMGSLYAQGSASEVSSLNDFAHNLGLAFQIQDDIMDLISDDTEFGKVKGQDLIEGKKSLPVILFAEKARAIPEYSKMMHNYNFNNGLMEQEVPFMIEAMHKLNIFSEAKIIANNYFTKANEALLIFEENESINALKWILDDLANRKK